MYSNIIIMAALGSVAVSSPVWSVLFAVYFIESGACPIKSLILSQVATLLAWAFFAVAAYFLGVPLF